MDSIVHFTGFLIGSSYEFSSEGNSLRDHSINQLGEKEILKSG